MTVIAISRQPGSLGDEIGQLVSKKLNLKFITDEDLHELALSCDQNYRDACRVFEKEEFRTFFERLMVDQSAYRSLFESLNFELASKGDVILIGRGSQIVFKNHPSVLKIRTVAKQSALVKRMMKKNPGWSQAEAEDYIVRFVKKRRTLVHSIFDESIDQPDLYDLVINTTDYSVDQVAEIICLAVKSKGTLWNASHDVAFFSKMARAKRMEAFIKHVVTIPPLHNLEVELENDKTVRLEGFVETEEDKKKAYKITRDFEGVIEVRNNLLVFKPRIYTT